MKNNCASVWLFTKIITRCRSTKHTISVCLIKYMLFILFLFELGIVLWNYGLHTPVVCPIALGYSRWIQVTGGVRIQSKCSGEKTIACHLTATARTSLGLNWILALRSRWLNSAMGRPRIFVAQAVYLYGWVIKSVGGSDTCKGDIHWRLAFPWTLRLSSVVSVNGRHQLCL